MSHPRPLLFTFVLFNYNFYRNFVYFSGNRTRIVGIEGEHADHHHCPLSSKDIGLKDSANLGQIAQWIRLRFSCFGPGFESQAYHISLFCDFIDTVDRYQLLLVLIICNSIVKLKI